MPLRGLAYFDKEYQGLLAEAGVDNFSERQIRLPSPRYLVLYNGRRDAPERYELRLSDAFAKPSRTLECVVEVVNVNAGHNRDLMEACPTLRGYAHLVAVGRANVEAGMSPGDAVDAAVEDCIARGMLREFLLKHRAEVKDMLLTEYNQERHERDMRDYWSERGREEGIAQGRRDALLGAVRSLMEATGADVDWALRSLGVPEAEWGFYTARVDVTPSEGSH